jgi:CBS domain-containing protein
VRSSGIELFIYSVTPETVVKEAAVMMTENGIGILADIQNDELVCILTERDMVNRVIVQEHDAATTCIETVMNPKPESVGPDQPFCSALGAMQERGYPGFRVFTPMSNGSCSTLTGISSSNPEQGEVSMLCIPERKAVPPGLCCTRIFRSSHLGPTTSSFPWFIPTAAAWTAGWTEFLNHWLLLKQNDGTMENAYQYWILKGRENAGSAGALFVTSWDG